MSSQNITVSHQIKNHLEHQIQTIVSQPGLFEKSPLDFSRNRKLSFGRKSLASELLSHFDFSPHTPTVPAFVQVRNKIKIEAFEGSVVKFPRCLHCTLNLEIWETSQQNQY